MVSKSIGLGTLKVLNSHDLMGNAMVDGSGCWWMKSPVMAMKSLLCGLSSSLEMLAPGVTW